LLLRHIGCRRCVRLSFNVRPHVRPHMPRTIYCWRCRMDMPMLAEDEWSLLEPHLLNMVAHIKRYREEHGCSLAEAQQGAGKDALALYEKLTGFRESNVNALHHHRLSIYGPPCHACGKPLRTPQSRYCAMCSAASNAQAGAQQ
jgi:hypothetical protein